jgi:hypothetical protein
VSVKRPFLLLATAALAVPVAAQEAPPASSPATTEAPAAPERRWTFGMSGALYVLPDEADFVQPTFEADRGALHLETRYNYEDRDSASVFAGANFEVGGKVKLTLTPMIGGLAGRTVGIVPGLETDLAAGPFEVYGEAEYVFDLDDHSSGYFYMWSELSPWPTEWLR